MSYEEWVEAVQRRTGLGTPELAGRVIEVTLEVLRQRLVDDEAAALAGELPERIGQILRGGAYEGDFGVEELYRRVKAREGVPLGFAAEHAQAALQVLGEHIDGELRLRLQRHLPEYAELFEPRQEPPPPLVPERYEHLTEPGQGTSLSDGRLGSRYPLSEAAPVEGHEHSVARSAEPHADTKMSSSHGLSQERSGDTLSTGKPGSSRPLHSGGR